MPRVTRSKVAAAEKPSKTASTIPAKRAPDDSANKEGETASAILPNAKRVAFSDKTNLPAKVNPEGAVPKPRKQKLPALVAQDASPTHPNAPEWAWDVCGRWEVRASKATDYSTLHRELDISDEGKGPMYLTIRSSATSGQKRQMWAEVEFGTLRGIIRFCPPKDTGGWPRYIADFEKACEFEGCWPGPSPLGQVYWHTRRRGANIETGLCQEADETQTDCAFGLDKDGRLTLKSFFVLLTKPISIEGFKIDEATSTHGYGKNPRFHFANPKPPPSLCPRHFRLDEDF